MKKLLTRFKALSQEEKSAWLKNAGLSVLSYALMLAVSFLPLLVWWREPDAIASGHDITWHRIWVFDLVQGWRNGFSGISLGHSLLGNLGYNVYGFYAPLSHYVVGIFVFMGMRVIDAWKFVGVVSVFLSGVWTYRLGILLSKNRGMALAFGIMYILLPYRYINFLVRAAFPEAIALSFIPLLFLGIFHILKDEKPKVGGYVCAILGSSCLVLSHPYTSLLTGILAVFVILANFKDLIRVAKFRNTWIFLPISAVLIFCLVGVYMVPMQQALASGYYRMSDEKAVWTNVEYLIKAEESSFTLSGFLCPELLTGLTDGKAWGENIGTWIWDIVVFVLGVGGSITAFALLKKKGKKNLALPVALLIALVPIFFRQREEVLIGIGIFAVLMILLSLNDAVKEEPLPSEKLSKDVIAEAKNPEIYVLVALFVVCFLYLSTDFMWVYSPSILRKGQFPFRFWGVMSFIMLFIAFILARAFRRYKVTKYVAAALAVSFLVVSHAQVDKRLSLYANRKGLSEPDESLVRRTTKMGVMNEYMPLVFYDDSYASEYPNSLFKEIKREVRTTHRYQYTKETYLTPVFLEGTGSIAITALNSPNVSFTVTIDSEAAFVQLPQFYYDGYRATLHNETSSYTVKGEYVDGLVGFRLRNGTYTMDVAFVGSNAYRALRPFFYVGIVGVVAFGLCGYFIPKAIEAKKKQREAEAC